LVAISVIRSKEILKANALFKSISIFIKNIKKRLFSKNSTLLIQSTDSRNLREAFVNNQQALGTCGRLLSTINKLLQLAGSCCTSSTSSRNLREAVVLLQQALATCGKLLYPFNKPLQLARLSYLDSEQFIVIYLTDFQNKKFYYKIKCLKIAPRRVQM
jgi:hypothetical protein